MAKSATVTKSKSATRAANDKKTRPTKPANEDKPKREPTAYQVFCKANMKAWNEANPGRAKEAMSEIALMWKDAPENPNRGKDSKARKPKEAKEAKPKAAPAAAAKAKSKPVAAAKPKAKPKPAKPVESEDEDDVAGASSVSGGDDADESD